MAARQSDALGTVAEELQTKTEYRGPAVVANGLPARQRGSGTLSSRFPWSRKRLCDLPIIVAWIALYFRHGPFAMIEVARKPSFACQVRRPAPLLIVAHCKFVGLPEPFGVVLATGFFRVVDRQNH